MDEEALSLLESKTNSELGHITVKAFKAALGYLKREQPPGTVEYMSFSVMGKRLAIPLNNVIGIGSFPLLTKVPTTPEWLLGLTNLRGSVVSVIDLCHFLGGGNTKKPESGRMLVIRLTDRDMTSGIIVERDSRIINATPEQIAEPPASQEGYELESFITGVFKDKDSPILIVDIEGFLNSPQIMQFD